MTKLTSIQIKNLQSETSRFIIQEIDKGEYDYFVMLETFGENEIDKTFWINIFKKYVPSINTQRIDFNFLAFTDPPRKAAGIGEIKTRLIFEPEFYEQNPEFFVCIDSDSNYLIQDTLTQNKKYVLQTYTYAIENHKLMPVAINDFVQKKYQSNFNFELFLNEYSNIIYPVFLYWIHICIRENSNRWDQQEWIKRIGVKNSFAELENNWQKVGENLKLEIKNWQENITEHIDFQYLDNYVKNLGVKAEECFLYVSGHAIEQIIKQIVRQIREKYLKIETEKIKQNNSKENWQELIENLKQKSHYDKDLKKLHPKCLENPHFLMNKIGQDAIRVFNS